MPDSYNAAFPGVLTAGGTSAPLDERRRLRNEKRTAERAAQQLIREEGKKIYDSWNLPILNSSWLVSLGRRKAYNRAESFRGLPRRLKVLVLCASPDNQTELDRTVRIVQLFHPSAGWNEMDVFIANPEDYQRSGRREPDGFHNYSDQPLIDRDHYLQISFGVPGSSSDTVDYTRLMQNAPFDFVIYMTCPIYGRVSPYEISDKTAGRKDLDAERQQLHRVTTTNSILIIDPLHDDNERKFEAYRLINDYAKLGFRILGYANVRRFPTEIGPVGVFLRST